MQYSMCAVSMGVGMAGCCFGSRCTEFVFWTFRGGRACAFCGVCCCILERDKDQNGSNITESGVFLSYIFNSTQSVVRERRMEWIFVNMLRQEEIVTLFCDDIL